MAEIIAVVACILGGAALWWIYYSAECMLNGSFRPIHCFVEELLWFLPGGDARKGEYIRKMVERGDGVICSANGSWNYKAVRDGELYVPCGKDVLPGRLHFVMTHLGVPLLPLAGYFAIRQLF